jgi:hypothetical protein
MYNHRQSIPQAATGKVTILQKRVCVYASKPFHPLSTVITFSRSDRISPPWREMRIRDVPAGTVGGRIAGAIMPFFLRKERNASARASSPVITGIICVTEQPNEK